MQYSQPCTSTNFVYNIHALLEFQDLPSPFLSAQIQTPGVKWCPWLCLIIQFMFPAHECACKSIFSCLYLWMSYLTGHELRIPIDCPVVLHCDVLWVLNVMVCPGRPLLLFLGFITFRTVTASDCFKWNKCIHSFFSYHFAKQVTLANRCIYLFL